jgi:anti-sigma regulatory factor (Ser/Thr protein kinase)
MPASRHVLRFSGTFAGFEEAANALQRLLEGTQLRASTRFNVELAFEEIGSNIVRHGSPTGDVQVAIAFDDDEVVLTFEDDGAPFDPGSHPAPLKPSSLDDAPIGGLGVMLVKRFSTRMEYERTAHDRNRLTLAIAAR